MAEGCNSGVFPSSGLPINAPLSEKNTYLAVAGALPRGWFAWHSIKIRIKPGEFSEADFVIADPARGILILEVKGGSVRKHDGVWLQNERPMSMSPLDQAHRFKRILREKGNEREIALPPIGVAVVFPDTAFESQPTQGDLEGLVMGARELQYLKDLLPKFFERALPGIRRPPSPDWTAFLHALWCESWPAAMNLSCVVKGREARRVRLDGEQFAALESVIGNEYTEALGFELAANLEGLGITVSPVGRFALERLRRRGFAEMERYEPEFWDRVTKRAAESGKLWEGCGFDTVIVDEGQDFGKHERAIVMRCAGAGEKGSGKSGKRGSKKREGRKREDGKRRIWVFADAGQAFWEKRKIPPAIEKHAVKFDLGRPYRCTPGIQALADAYVEKNSGFEAVDGWAFGALRVVVTGSELEKDKILKRLADLAEAKA